MTQAKGLQSFSLKAMGSPCEVKFYANDEQAEFFFHQARDRLLALEHKYSRYRPDSVTSIINQSAGSGEPVAIDPETFGLIHYANTLYRQSNGLFDITSGVLRKAWDFRSGKVPEPELIHRLLPKIGWQKIRYSATDIVLPVDEMEIDFGGFVKEYAADQLADLLRSFDVSHGLVNLGGDIVVIGPHPDGKPWLIGIQHPRKAAEPLTKLALYRGALATSGDYERFMIVDGRRYCHLLNPLTGYPVQSRYASATVVADQCLIAGSFSTLALLNSELEPNWLQDSGVGYLLVDQQMTSSFSHGMHGDSHHSSST